MNNLPQAENYYKKSLAAKESLGNPIYAKLFRNLGKIYFNSGRLDEASEVFYKCLKELQKYYYPKNKLHLVNVKI